MSLEGAPPMERVALLAPTEADGEIATSVLREAGIPSLVFRSFGELCKALRENVGAVMLVEEELSDLHLKQLGRALWAQPAWSSIPFIVLTRRASRSHSLAIEHLRTALLLERPVRIETLLSALRGALDARRRQYMLRDLLEGAQRAAEERSRLLQEAQQARAQAEAANRMKDEFLAVLSHELRSPLNAISGWATLLKRHALTEAQVERAVESIERNSRLQSQLIDDLLDMSRVISGTLRLSRQPVELTGIVDEAIATVTPVSVEAGVRLESSKPAGPLLVRGDPARLQQIVWNLLTNAIKFTPAAGTVRIELGAAGANAELRVIDTGEGIAADFLPQIFERFRQADSSTTRQRGGLGLGLAIVKQLVELHQGSIEAASPGPGQGATFTLRLPLMPERQREGTAAVASPKAVAEDEADQLAVQLPGVRVLLVDDDIETLQMLSIALTKCGATVVTAETAGAALEIARRSVPDVLVSDISMPGQDGYALIRALRQAPDPAIRDISAIALTAHARTEDHRATREAGFQRHVSKPVQLHELLNAVACSIGRPPVA